MICYCLFKLLLPPMIVLQLIILQFKIEVQEILCDYLKNSLYNYMSQLSNTSHNYNMHRVLGGLYDTFR